MYRAYPIYITPTKCPSQAEKLLIAYVGGRTHDMVNNCSKGRLWPRPAPIGSGLPTCKAIAGDGRPYCRVISKVKIKIATTARLVEDRNGPMTVQIRKINNLRAA